MKPDSRITLPTDGDSGEIVNSKDCGAVGLNECQVLLLGILACLIIDIAMSRVIGRKKVPIATGNVVNPVCPGVRSERGLTQGMIAQYKNPSM